MSRLPVSVSIEDAPAPDVLMPDWLALEHQAPSSFFQSWAWVGTWLHCQPAGTAIKCVRAFKQDKPVAIGLLGSHLTTRHKVIRSRQWCVSETGDPVRDGLTIEHNGFLIGHLAGDDALRTIFNALRSRGKDWDELVVSGVDAGEAQRYSQAAQSIGLHVLTRWSKPYFVVTAEDVTANGGDYLASLSGNTRYQIRRAMREYERSGPLAVTRAQSLDQAMAYFDELVQLHQAYWNARGQPGAFASEFARRFHRTLIETWLPSGCIHLLRVAAGKNLIGYLYNFEHRGVISSYQSGFRYGDNPKLKPGLVSHALAIQTSLSAGASSYDLLMGKQQYKEMLATRRGEMSWLVIQQPRGRFAFERGARAVVSTLRALRAKALPRGESESYRSSPSD